MVFVVFFKSLRTVIQSRIPLESALEEVYKYKWSALLKEATIHTLCHLF